MIVWTAQVEVPSQGVQSKTPTIEDMLANHDEEQPKNFDKDKKAKELEEMNKPPAANAN